MVTPWMRSEPHKLFHSSLPVFMEGREHHVWWLPKSMSPWCSEHAKDPGTLQGAVGGMALPAGASPVCDVSVNLSQGGLFGPGFASTLESVLHTVLHKVMLQAEVTEFPQQQTCLVPL